MQLLREYKALLLILTLVVIAVSISFISSKEAYVQKIDKENNTTTGELFYLLATNVQLQIEFIKGLTSNSNETVISELKKLEALEPCKKIKTRR